MPINCFHRGNTREGDDDHRDLAARDALLQHLLLKLHAAKEAHFNHLEIKNSDLGKYDVSLRWDEASLSDVHTLQDLGTDCGETPVSECELTALMKALAGTSQRNSSPLNPLCAEDDEPTRAAERDLTKFIKDILSPMFLLEMYLLNSVGEELRERKLL